MIRLPITPRVDLHPAGEAETITVLHIGQPAHRWPCTFHPGRPADAMMSAAFLTPNVLYPVCAACAVTWARLESPAPGVAGGADSAPPSSPIINLPDGTDKSRV